MLRHLFVTIVVLAAASSSLAQVIYCPPVVIVRPVYLCPPVVCVPCPLAAAAAVEPKTPTVVPERMREPEKSAGSESLPTPRQFATPTPVESKSVPKPAVTPASGIGETIPPVPVPMTPVPMTPMPTTPMPTTPAPTDPTPGPGESARKPADPPAGKPTGDLPKFEFQTPAAESPKPTDTLPPLDVPLPKPNDEPKAPPPQAPAASLPKFDVAFPNAELAQPTEANKPTVARSSPLSTESRPAFDVYPVDGPPPASPTAKRTVGFVNKSDRDLLLTIDGKMVTLPTKNVLRAELPTAFKWQIGGGAEYDLTVPTTAPGVDVIIRR